MFSEPVPLACDLYKYFSTALPPTGDVGRAEGAGVGISLPPPGLLFGKTQIGWALVE